MYSMSWRGCLLLAFLLARSASAAGDATCETYSINDHLVGGGPPGHNVLNNSCSRVWQQSVLKDDTLWIDGGAQYFTEWQDGNTVALQRNGPITVGQNLYLIETPANQTWDWKCNITQIAHNKTPNPLTGQSPPQVIHGSLYSGLANDSRIWLFGGTTFMGNTSSAANYTPPYVDQYSLWSFDTASLVWGQTDVSLSAPKRPFNGFSAEAADKGLAFWINGELNNGSSQASASSMGTNTEFLNDMLTFDFSNPSNPVVQNITGPPWGDPRVGGLMHYVPNYGSQGILIAFGGGAKSASEVSANASGSYVSMNEIWIMDLAKFNRASGVLSPDAWQKQTTTGNSPPSRQDSCVVGLPATDSSSYQIYMYGGRLEDTIYDDIWALSLPQFTWTQTYAGAAPRFGHTCQLYKNWQMITAGGANSTNLTAGCDWESRGVAVYDFSGQASGNWGSIFRAADTAPPYKIPSPVYHDIGGDANGGATQQAPKNGWANNQIQTLFAESPSTAQHISSLSGGAIAGIVVGVVLGVICIIILVWLLVRHRSKRRGGGKDVRDTTVSDDPITTTLSTHRSSHSQASFTQPSPVIYEAQSKEVSAIPQELPVREIQEVHEMDSAGAEVYELSVPDKEKRR